MALALLAIFEAKLELGVPSGRLLRRPASRLDATRLAFHPGPDDIPTMKKLASIAGPKSRALFAQALKRIPGGVNSPVRAWKRLGGNPLVIDHGEGPFLFDADGRRYID